MAYRAVWLVVACTLGVAYAACSTPRFPEVASPPRAPKVRDATDLIPADLDVVVRVDLEQIRRALGPLAITHLREASLSAGASALGRALEKARTVWVALRPTSGVSYDSVWVLEGDFRDVDPYTVDPKAWSRGVALGGLIRLYEHRGRVARSEAARCYADGDQLLAFVSGAEIDSVERVLESGPDVQRLEPVAAGLLSFQLRPRALPSLLPERAPKMAELLGRTLSVNGTLTQRGEFLEAVVDAGFSSEQAAAEAHQWVTQLLAVAATRYPNHASVIAAVEPQVAGVRLRLHARLEPSLFR